MRALPTVTVIVPCYNEARTIGLLLQALYRQTYPRPLLDVVVADGMSTDGTRTVIAEFCRAHPDLRVTVCDNPKRNIPAALNVALAAATGTIVVRMDAHAVPATDYVARCVDDLQAGKGENVGGVWQIVPGADGWIAQAIALAAAHPLAVGDAHYRHAPRTAKAVDTVPFGAFYRRLMNEIGGFDETLLSNEDYEFNARIRQRGGVVWLNPEIRCTYFARPTLKKLAQQYARYGFWKVRMLYRYPNTLRWRQALPPLFVLSALILLLIVGFSSLARWLLAVQLGFYGLTLLWFGVRVAHRATNWKMLPGFVLAVATMHFAWGGAFLWSALHLLFSKQPRS